MVIEVNIIQCGWEVTRSMSAVVSDHTQQDSIFRDTFSRNFSLFFLHRILVRYVLNLSCHQAADIVWMAPLCWYYHMNLSFVIHKGALLKHEAIQLLFHFNSATLQFRWIWCRNLAIAGRIRPNKFRKIENLSLCGSDHIISAAWSQWFKIYLLQRMCSRTSKGCHNKK